MKSVLLEFLSTDEKTIIFLIRQDWKKKGIKDSEPLVFEANFSESAVLHCVEEIRGLYDEWRDEKYHPNYLDTIKLEERTDFYTIGNKIFSDDLMSAIDGYDLIYFVPFSALHHLPLHAMRYKGSDIVDSFAFSYLPSASVLQFINANKKRPKAFNFKGIGVDFKQELRAFVTEVRDIKKERYWNKKEYFINNEATKENFFSNNEQYNILHCSTHGFFASNALESGIVLKIPQQLMLKKGEVLENKLQENQELQQSIITVNDLIKELNSEFELVFFSACVSGENKNESGDELIGLSRGLFYAGTKAMILSLFNTFKNVTVDNDVHIKNFYQYWIEEKQPKAKAFQRYIQEVKAKDEYKHPFYWFAYILIGNPY